MTLCLFACAEQPAGCQEGDAHGQRVHHADALQRGFACLLVLNSKWDQHVDAAAHLIEEELQTLAFASMLRQNVQVCTTAVYHLGCHPCKSDRLGTS